jgi:hypothetical protein
MPTTTLAVHGLLSVSAAQDVGQLPSQSSPRSGTPLPHEGGQSLSLVAFAPKGQHESPLAAPRIGAKLQRMPHALGTSPLVVHARKSSHCPTCVGHKPSQNSPRSITRLPHIGWQSLSLVALPRSGGQQPSPLIVRVIAACAQFAVQLLAEPVGRSSVQGSLSSQDVGQGRSGLAGSQRSPPASSTTPSPQPVVTGQSLSVSRVQLSVPQHPSPLTHAENSTISQVWLHVLVSPPGVATRQRSALIHGQLSSGSHVSPASSIPFPHTAAGGQSGSVSSKQQPSPEVALWIG